MLLAARHVPRNYLTAALWRVRKAAEGCRVVDGWGGAMAWDDGPEVFAVPEAPTAVATGPAEPWEAIERLQVQYERQRPQRRNRQTGCIATPPAIARLMARRLVAACSPGRTLRILDAGCGSATLLAAAARAAVNKQLAVRAHGIDTDATTVAWAADMSQQVKRAGGPLLQTWKIRCGDYLLQKTNQRYDLIISNPPYVSLRSLPESLRRQLQNSHACGRGDLSALFVASMLDQLGDGGRLCAIVPNKLLVATYATALRRRLLSEFQLTEVHDLSRDRTFPGVGAYPVILVVDRVPARRSITVLGSQQERRGKWEAKDIQQLPGALLPLGLPSTLIQMVNRLRARGTLGEAVSIGCGIAVSGFGRAVGSGRHKIILSGDVGAFSVRRRRAFHPAAAGIPTARLERQRVEKIIVPGMFQELCAARSAATDLLGRVYFIPVGAGCSGNAPAQASLLLALLNSRLFRVLYRGLFEGVAQAGGWLRLNGPYLASLPWPQQAASPELLEIVEALELTVADDAIERLDVLVAQLFALSDREVRAVDRLFSEQRRQCTRRSGRGSSRQAALSTAKAPSVIHVTT